MSEVRFRPVHGQVYCPKERRSINCGICTECGHRVKQPVDDVGILCDHTAKPSKGGKK